MYVEKYICQQLLIESKMVDINHDNNVYFYIYILYICISILLSNWHNYSSKNSTECHHLGHKDGIKIAIDQTLSTC